MENLPFGLTLNRIKIIAIIVGSIIGIFLLIFFGARMIKSGPSIELTVWGVFDDKKAFDALVAAYKTKNPKTTITYVQKESESYEKDLINALADGTGPDIFMVQNGWLPKHQTKLAPFDAQLQTELKYPFVNYRDSFPKVVSDDFVRDTTIYASPLYLDTLAMFYNRDFFDRKGIVLVPSTWLDFDRIVPQLREIDPSTNEIYKAAAAIGGSDASINRATDLLTAIMMQRGAVFTDNKDTRATFAQSSGSVNYGLDGLKDYTKFANPLSSLYTWSERFPYSVDSFASGDTAIMFNYAHEIPVIKSKNAFLDFRIAPLPQPAGTSQPINYANYWGLAVSKQSKYPNWAWDFIISVTTDEPSVNAYGEITGKPPALLTAIARKINDPMFGVFARQALTARSWRQKDSSAIKEIFSNMIKSVIKGELSAEVALGKAEDAVSLIMR